MHFFKTSSLMKYIHLMAIFLAFLFFGLLQAQENKKSLPYHVKKVMNLLQGKFTWQMIRPSTNEILRTGIKESHYELDSSILITKETFDTSNVKQIGFFGYKEIDSSYFFIQLYNVDIGPHILKGYINKDLNRITFPESDSSKFYLNFVGNSEYYWTYETLKNDEWIKRDLQIIFKRE